MLEVACQNSPPKQAMQTSSQSDYKADGVIFDLHILQAGTLSPVLRFGGLLGMTTRRLTLINRVMKFYVNHFGGRLLSEVEMS
ncbi:hypothetical protein NPIL_213911 [Nephila pilipes]|uniref:Uncharacterized protein n=1 Tax=Nephila pilipes TaxID=299642 RepID=A0A8X6TWL9_NEPPI|nr:hypothetical protein NPIL_213911 [Nephila pilipes]